MGRKIMETTTSIRDLVIQCWEDKENGPCSIREIAKRLKVSKSTVGYIIKKYKITGSIENTGGRGRKQALTHREVKLIDRAIKKSPFKTAKQLCQQVQEQFQKTLTTQTIRNYVHKAGFKARQPRKKPWISKVNQRKRLEFARRHKMQPLSFWNKVLWTDETKINLFGSDGKQKVWRKPGQALKSCNLLPTVKHGGGSVMAWGAMSAAGVGNLEFIDTKMNADYYIGILERNIKQSATNLGLGRRFVMQQDNDPKHTSKKATQYLKKNNVQVLLWPPQSPDLNPIEHLWDHVKQRLKEDPVRNKKLLKSKIQEIWGSIDPKVTEKLVESLPRRLEAVLKAGGGPTDY